MKKSNQKKEFPAEEEKLQASLLDAKRVYEGAVRQAKIRYKFRTSDAKEQAKQIIKLSEEGERWERLSHSMFHNCEFKRRAEIASILLSRSTIIKVHIQKFQGLNISNMSLSKEQYRIEFYLMQSKNKIGSLTLRHNVEYWKVPDGEIILTIAKQYFPKVQRIDII